MAFRVGGASGLKKALDSKNTCTIVYSSGLQVTGTVAEFKVNKSNEPYFIKTSGPSALSVNNKQLHGHGKDYHKDGFSSPVGKLKGYQRALEDFSEDELSTIGIKENETAVLDFESGITVNGHIKSILINNEKVQLITFTDCTVKDKEGNVLFDPTWGVYDMAVGEKIFSVFCGAADKKEFIEVPHKSATGTHHVQYDANTLELHQLYQQVRNRRHTGGDYGFLGNVWRKLQINHHDDWLCALEILELLDHENAEPQLTVEIRDFLEQKAAHEPEFTKLINDGLYLIKHPVEQNLIF
jgi:phenylalanine-4-hydroxylase